MRKETKKIAAAFLAGKPAAAARTKTDGTTLWLHGHAIAWHEAGGVIALTLAGWGSVTTRDRLNGLCQLAIGKRPFGQRDFVQHFDGQPISPREIIQIRN